MLTQALLRGAMLRIGLSERQSDKHWTAVDGSDRIVNLILFYAKQVTRSV
jgi:hypothetical protein